MSRTFSYKYQCLWYHLNTRYLNKKVKVKQVIKEMEKEYDVVVKATTTYHYLNGLRKWGFINEDIPKYTQDNLEIKLLSQIPESFKTSYFDMYLDRKEQRKFIEELKVIDRKNKMSSLLSTMEFNKHIENLTALSYNLKGEDSQIIKDAIEYINKLK